MFDFAGGGGVCKLVVPARGEVGGIRVFVALPRLELDGRDSVSDGTKAEVRVVKRVADEVGAVRGGFRSVGGQGSMNG